MCAWRRETLTARVCFIKKQELLSADEIRAIRDRFNLTQADLARLLRLGANTVPRFTAGNAESGMITARLIPDFSPKSEVVEAEPERVKVEHLLRGRVRAEIATTFSEGAIAKTTVGALDHRAAEAIALERVRRSDLEKRILNAMSWAGKASTEYRRAQSFLLFAIAIEALLTTPDRRSGIGERLRMRAAHLLGTDKETRKKIADDVSAAYRLRGTLVHSGDATDVTDGDLDHLRWITRSLILTALTQREVAAFPSAAAFDQWLDDKLFG